MRAASIRSTPAPPLHTQVMKTEALKQALDDYGFDAAIGGARRDEEKSRAKERIFSLRSARPCLGSAQPAPGALAALQHARRAGRDRCASSRSPTGPSSTSGTTSAPRTSRSCRSISPSERPVVERDGALIMVDDERLPLAAGEAPRMRRVRFRTLGCYPLTGAIESTRPRRRRHRRRAARQPRLGAAGPPDRPRRDRLDGEEEARGLFLMRAPPDRRRRSQPASLPHLRLGRRRQVDADRPAAPRHRQRHRRPARGAGARLARGMARPASDLDFALLADGLEAEREQGITIDVAYRYFATPRRSFIVADTPGHEQYTRNMATGASNAELAVLLVDARKGVLPQTRRHARIARCSASGTSCWRSTRSIWSAAIASAFRRDRRRLSRHFARQLGFAIRASRFRSRRATATMSSRAAPNMPWYDGPTLLEHLEARRGRGRPRGAAVPLAGPVGDPADRCRAASIRARSRAARCRVGDAVVVASSGRASTRGAHRHRRRRSRRGAQAGDAVAIWRSPTRSTSPAATCWRRRTRRRRSPTSSRRTWSGWPRQPLLPGRRYLHEARHPHAAGHRDLDSSTSSTSTRWSTSRRARCALNEIGVCNVATALPIAFDALCREPATPAASS